jgi:phospholipid/cholesterol/gamma-HCH transport system substrate-binding protein
VKRAISIHRRDFISIIALVAIAVAVTGYIFAHQPSFTLLKNYYVVKVPFSSASAVTAGQGQTVDIAGVPVGQVGGVSLHGGQAVVTMDIYKQYQPIYRNATVLLRPRTPLKDMYLALDPGTPSAGAVPAGGLLPVGASIPDVDFAQIINSLDADTRAYLLLLLSGGAQAFHTGGGGERPDSTQVADLRSIFKRFVPLDRDTRTFTSLLAQRQRDIRGAIHGLQQVATSLGGVEAELSSLIDASNTNFKAISSQAVNLQQALTLFPGTLQQSAVTFAKLRGFALASGAANQRLLPFARYLAPALAATRPLFRDTTPVIRDQLRPFAIAVQPVARILAPASAALARATPPLTRSFGVLNKLFNTLAYDPGTGQQSYLFWGSWLAHNADSLTALQDAQGPTLHGMFMAVCPELQLLEVSLLPADPSIGSLLDLLGAPDWSKLPGSTAAACASS